MVMVVVVAAVVVVSSIRCGFKIVQRQVNETIIIIFVVVVISFFFLMLMMMLLPMMMIHEVHVVVILQIVIRTGFSVIHNTDSSSIVGVGVDDFYHSICYIHEAKSRPDFLSFEVCMFYGEVMSAASSSYGSPSAVGGAHGPGFGCLHGGGWVIRHIEVEGHFHFGTCTV